MTVVLSINLAATLGMEFVVGFDGRKLGNNIAGTGQPQVVTFTGTWDPTVTHALNMRIVVFNTGDVLRTTSYTFNGVTTNLMQTLSKENDSFNITIPVSTAPVQPPNNPPPVQVCKPIKFWVAIAGLELGIVTPASTISYFTKLGMGGRIVVKQKTLQPTIGGPLDQTAVNNLLNTVAQYVAAGQPCAIDFHDYAKPYGAVIGTAGTVTWDQWRSFVLQIASLPGILNQPLVRISLMNEPQMDAATWFSEQKTTVDYLEAAGIQNLLGLSTTNNDGLLGVPYQGFWTNKTTSNVRPEGHRYSDAPGFTGTGRVNSTTLYAFETRNVITGLRQQPGNINPVFWSEIGFSQDQTSYTAARNLFNLLQRYTQYIPELSFWMGGKEVAPNQPGVAPHYVYDVNPNTDGTDSPVIAIAKEYMTGGVSYLVAAFANTGLGYTVSGTVTFAAGYMTGGQASLPSGMIVGGGTAFTKRIRFVINSLPITNTSVYLMGDFNSLSVMLDSNGTLHFSCGASKRVTMIYAAGLKASTTEHVVEIGADATGIYCFLDGVLVAASKTAWAATEPAYQQVIGIGSNGKLVASATLSGKRRWFELFDYVVNTKNHTISTTRPAPGDDIGRICFAPLETDLSIYA